MPSYWGVRTSVYDLVKGRGCTIQCIEQLAKLCFLRVRAFLEKKKKSHVSDCSVESQS